MRAFTRKSLRDKMSWFIIVNTYSTFEEIGIGVLPFCIATTHTSAIFQPMYKAAALDGQKITEYRKQGSVHL